MSAFLWAVQIGMPEGMQPSDQQVWLHKWLLDKHATIARLTDELETARQRHKHDAEEWCEERERLSAIIDGSTALKHVAKLREQLAKKDAEIVELRTVCLGTGDAEAEVSDTREGEPRAYRARVASLQRAGHIQQEPVFTYVEVPMSEAGVVMSPMKFHALLMKGVEHAGVEQEAR